MIQTDTDKKIISPDNKQCHFSKEEIHIISLAVADFLTDLGYVKWEGES